VNVVDSCGRTSAVWAVHNNNMSLVRMLHRAGADFFADSWDTPLKKAFETDNPRMVLEVMSFDYSPGMGKCVEAMKQIPFATHHHFSAAVTKVYLAKVFQSYSQLYPAMVDVIFQYVETNFEAEKFGNMKSILVKEAQGCDTGLAILKPTLTSEGGGSHSEHKPTGPDCLFRAKLLEQNGPPTPKKCDLDDPGDDLDDPEEALR